MGKRNPGIERGDVDGVGTCRYAVGGMCGKRLYGEKMYRRPLIPDGLASTGETKQQDDG